tara:strand:- start:185 stop:532 length:348 start_codon:yes stop_codon:yes gene_type:complete
VKDLENLKGDLAQEYHTIPVVYGEKLSKKMLTVLAVLTAIPTYFLLTRFEIGYMNIYFFISILGLLLFLGILWYSKRKLHYVILHNILKLIIVIGVFSIVLIDVDLLLNRFLLKI